MQIYQCVCVWFVSWLYGQWCILLYHRVFINRGRISSFRMQCERNKCQIQAIANEHNASMAVLSLAVNCMQASPIANNASVWIVFFFVYKSKTWKHQRISRNLSNVDTGEKWEQFGRKFRMGCHDNSVNWVLLVDQLGWFRARDNGTNINSLCRLAAATLRKCD